MISLGSLMEGNLEHIDIKNEIIYRTNNGIELWIKREDLIHPIISGNKFRKLKYNIDEAKTSGNNMLITFGGAYSNHIAAVAAAGELHNLETLGIIRGEELKSKVNKNPTLLYATEKGMQLKFISRAAYRQKSQSDLLEELKNSYPDAYIIPEGGTNNLAIKGCKEILNKKDDVFDVICCAVGTGGTLSGLINSSSLNQTVIGFSALKGDFLNSEISKFVSQNNWKLNTNYHFGGYSKINKELIAFLNDSYHNFGIKFDPIYTGKMMYGIMDLIKNDYFKPNSKILAIHTGGIQGIKGMNIKLKNAGLPLINFE